MANTGAEAEAQALVRLLRQVLTVTVSSMASILAVEKVPLGVVAAETVDGVQAAALRLAEEMAAMHHQYN